MAEPTIICPKCKNEIKLTESLAAPLIETTRRDYEQRLAQKDLDIARSSPAGSRKPNAPIANDDAAPANPESRRDAKGALDEFMPPDRAYSGTGDQPAMSATLDLGLAHRRNRSFRKLVRAVGDLLTQPQPPLPAWPPAQWPPE
ncbi:MAG: hypothetical protein ACYDH9_09625 [Limisphaerales bacterium]